MHSTKLVETPLPLSAARK